jgi:lambda family phage portal protein
LEAIDAALIDHELNQTARDGVNQINLGIESDAYGRTVAYWLRDPYAGQYNVVKPRRIDASRVLHLFIPERVDQARGAPWLNSAMKPLRHLDGYVEAELIAARAGAARLGVAKANDLFDPDKQKGEQRMQFRAGTLQVLPPGIELQEWSPDHPSAAFPAFTKAALRQIACGLGVSYNALANDLEGVNYSSMRSGLLIERDEWKCLQQWLIDEFFMPVYERWLASAMFVGAVTGVPGQMPTEDMLEARWHPRGWAWVDPLKDINAAILAVNNGFTSRQEVIAETGGDFEETIEQLKEEEDLIAAFDVTLRPTTGTGNSEMAPEPAADAPSADAARFDTPRTLQ